MLQEILEKIDKQDREWHKTDGWYDPAYKRGVIKGLALAKRIIMETGITKTDKYNNMLSAFQCDFSLAKEGEFKLAELDAKIESKEPFIMKDIELLEELEWMLRNGRAEIYVRKEPVK